MYRGLLNKKWKSMDRGRDDVKDWQKCADIHYG